MAVAEENEEEDGSDDEDKGVDIDDDDAFPDVILEEKFVNDFVGHSADVNEVDRNDYISGTESFVVESDKNEAIVVGTKCQL